MKESGTKNSVYKQINDIIENIRPNVRMYQINYFPTDEARNNALALDKLPMAWETELFTKLKNAVDAQDDMVL